MKTKQASKKNVNQRQKGETAIAAIKRIFSVRNVRARYAKIDHEPVRGIYGGSWSHRSCLLGSFEHAMSAEMSIGGAGTIDLTRLPGGLVRELEAGWEGWNVRGKGGGMSMGPKPVGLSKPGTTKRAAYDWGQYLAKVFKPVRV